MKKRTLTVLLISIFLMVLGAILFLLPIFMHTTVSKPTTYTVNTSFQHLEIDLENTDLTICSDSQTYIEISGYRESEYFISEKDGKLLITNQSEKSPLLFKLSGIGKFFRESREVSDQKSIVLHLSQNHQQTPVNIILKDSSLTLSASLPYLTLHAENSSVTAKDIAFERFNAKLTNCNSVFSFPYPASGFSRNIETHTTVFSINGDNRANTEKYLADFQKPSLTIEAVGGSCHLEYQQDNS